MIPGWIRRRPAVGPRCARTEQLQVRWGQDANQERREIRCLRSGAAELPHVEHLLRSARAHWLSARARWTLWISDPSARRPVRHVPLTSARSRPRNPEALETAVSSAARSTAAPATSIARAGTPGDPVSDLPTRVRVIAADTRLRVRSGLGWRGRRVGVWACWEPWGVWIVVALQVSWAGWRAEWLRPGDGGGGEDGDEGLGAGRGGWTRASAGRSARRARRRCALGSTGRLSAPGCSVG